MNCQVVEEALVLRKYSMVLLPALALEHSTGSQSA